LKDSIRLLESVFKSSIQAIIMIDEKGIIRQYNPAKDGTFCDVF
jgi:hypothetical protein